MQTSHYRINVARYDGMNWNGTERKYVHHFRVLITDRPDAEQVTKDLRARFLEPEFQITVTYWDVRGTSVEW